MEQEQTNTYGFFPGVAAELKAQLNKPVVESDDGVDTFADIFKGATTELQAIAAPTLPVETSEADEAITQDLMEDPVGYPIDNQAELADIDNYTPQTTDVIDHNVQPALVAAVEAINDLLDMHHTIATCGVSSHDMAGLNSIQQRLTTHGLVLPAVSMEDHYLPTRSLLNQSLGLENIGKVIVDTIKAWIRKLIELVMQGYRWVKALKQKHVVLDAQLVKARDVLIQVRKIYLTMKTLNGSMGTEAVKATNELTATALVASKLDRNRTTLYGFSHEQSVKDVKTLYTSALATSEAIAKRVKDLTELIDNKDIPSDDGMCALNDLASVIQSVDEMTSFSDDDEYLLKSLGTDFWEQVELFRKVAVIDFDVLAKHYGNTADALGRIRSIKLEDPEQAERTQVVIDGITKATDHLNKIVNFFNRAAQAQVGAARVYRDYYQQAIEILLLDFKNKSPSSDSVKTMKGLIQQLTQLK